MQVKRCVRRSAALQTLALALAVAITHMGAPSRAEAQTRTPHQQLTFDIYKELVEINTSQSVGDTYKASQAMAAHLLAAGFPEADVLAIETAPKRGNLVARYRGTGKRKPVLLLAHIDVVEAKREDWSTDPYQLVERDGYYYGRGTADDKYMAAMFIANFVRYRQEGYRPDRDLIIALTTDEEISDQHEYGIRWLLKNRRDLIDAEFALNEGGGVAAKDGKAVSNSVQTTEKLFQSYWLEVRDKGGHSSQPTRNNAIYRLSEGLTRLSKYDFPVQLNDTTRAYFTRLSQIETGPLAADMKAVATSTPPDPAAVARMSAMTPFNAQLRTTCVAVRLEGGHADNALPQLARAMVNCRIVPGMKPAEVQKLLVEVVADKDIVITPEAADTASDPSKLDPQVFGPIEKLTKKLWPGIPVLPTMSAGATDGRFLRNAGIPTYGTSGLEADMFDVRAHGRDERVNIQAFYKGQDYLYQLVRTLAGGK